MPLFWFLAFTTFWITTPVAWGQSQPAKPLSTITWTNPTETTDLQPLTDLAAVVIDCAGHQVTVATTEVGAAMSEPFPSVVESESGVVTCLAWAVNAAGESGPASEPFPVACGGGRCFPLGRPAAPRLSVQ